MRGETGLLSQPMSRRARRLRKKGTFGSTLKSRRERLSKPCDLDIYESMH